MELGATVCTPRQPGCGVCPVRRWCVTQGEEVESKNASPRQAKKEIWCALDWRDGQVRLVRRPVNGSLMAGMWELPQFLPKASEAIVAGPSYWRKFRHSITVTDLHRPRGPAGRAWGERQVGRHRDDSRYSHHRPGA